MKDMYRMALKELDEITFQNFDNFALREIAKRGLEGRKALRVNMEFKAAIF